MWTALNSPSLKRTKAIICGVQIIVSSLMTWQTKLRRRLPKPFYSSLFGVIYKEQ